MSKFMSIKKGTLIRNLAVLGVALLPAIAMATGTPPTAGDIALNASKSMSGLQIAMQGFFYLCGVGMFGGAFFKFKAHKDNPQQTPLSTPIVMLVLGAGLLYLPSVIGSTGQSLFGGSQDSKKIDYIYTS